MTATLTKPALPALQQLISLLVDHDITPLHLHADSVATEQPRASLTLWTHTRTEIERLGAALGRTPAERPRPFVEPIRGVNGALGLWKPDDELLHLIGDRLVATVVDRAQRQEARP